MRPPSKTIDVTGAPIDVIPGESIAHITLGMKRADVETLGIHLTPETTPRVDRKGWLAGPLLVLVDPADRVVLVSVELRASRGLRVAGRAVPNTATLAQIASLVPGCTRGSGSGGDFVDCRGASGKLTHFWGSHGTADISVTLDEALLR
jgi:hypothetical protein